VACAAVLSVLGVIQEENLLVHSETMYVCRLCIFRAIKAKILWFLGIHFSRKSSEIYSGNMSALVMSGGIHFASESTKINLAQIY
jgi:hypothetical protein